MGTLAKSGDPDEMPQFAKIKQSSGTEVHLLLEISSCDPLIWTMNHPRLIISNQVEEFISIQRLITQKIFSKSYSAANNGDSLAL